MPFAVLPVEETVRGILEHVVHDEVAQLELVAGLVDPAHQVADAPENPLVLGIRWNRSLPCAAKPVIEHAALDVTRLDPRIGDGQWQPGNPQALFCAEHVADLGGRRQEPVIRVVQRLVVLGALVDPLANHLNLLVRQGDATSGCQ